jgi:hypothetical protein
MPLSVTLEADSKFPDTLRLSSGCPDIEQELVSASPHILITINDPQTLSCLGAKLATADSELVISKPQSSRESADGIFSIPMKLITTLRIGILAPISPNEELTPAEENGDIHGPVMSSLVQNWRDAFSRFPERHPIERVQFDMQCALPPQKRHIAHLLQQVGTVMYVKVKRTTGRELVFNVVGCQDAKKERWLEGCLPGKKEANLRASTTNDHSLKIP